MSSWVHLMSAAMGAALLSGLLSQGEPQATPKEKPLGNAGESGGQRSSQPTRIVSFDLKQFLQEHDKNQDGTLDKAELPVRFHDRFAHLDKNKDGRITLEELEQQAALLQPPRRPADVLVVLLEMSDCDECCVEELQLFYSQLRKLDRDNDGKLSPEELAVGRKELVGQRVDHLLKNLDSNKDGRLGREETRGYLQKDFDQIDTNRDGSLTREELLKAASQPPASAKPGDKPN